VFKFVDYVRTKALRQALGGVLGRALGRQVSGDEEKVSQDRRPTTSADRQRQPQLL